MRGLKVERVMETPMQVTYRWGFGGGYRRGCHAQEYRRGAWRTVIPEGEGWKMLEGAWRIVVPGQGTFERRFVSLQMCGLKVGLGLGV